MLAFPPGKCLIGDIAVPGIKPTFIHHRGLLGCKHPRGKVVRFYLFLTGGAAAEGCRA